MAVIAVHTGDMRRVLLESQQTRQLADASGDRMYCYFSYGYQVLAHSRLGEHAAAADNLTRQRDMAASLGRNLATADWFAAMEAEVALNAGRSDEALALAHAAIEDAVAVDGLYSEGFARRVCGQALAATGAPRSAIDGQFASSVECFDRGGRPLSLRARMRCGARSMPAAATERASPNDAAAPRHRPSHRRGQLRARRARRARRAAVVSKGLAGARPLLTAVQPL